MKATHKKLVGKGGIKCSCCRLGRNCLKETRVKLNRVTRRAFKIISKTFDISSE